MKRVEDLISSAKATHDRYAAGRMDREIVRQWMLGLSSAYPAPYGEKILEAVDWFRPARDDMDPVELKIADLARLHAIYAS